MVPHHDYIYKFDDTTPRIEITCWNLIDHANQKITIKKIRYSV